MRAHFEADARRFDEIYVDDKGPFGRFVDNWWRGVVRRRLELTLESLGPLDGKTVLDVGCGSGRFCIAYAQRGAARVVGIDFASGMIDIARRLADENGVADRCEFVVGSFPQTPIEGPFDAATANGFFDYVDNPTELIRRMRDVSSETLVMSFPKAREWRVPLRRLRFRLKGTPLFLYGETAVRRILDDAGIHPYEWIELDRDYFVVARLNGAADPPARRDGAR